MAYCDHKVTNTCNDCVDDIISLRHKVRRLETEIERLKEAYDKLELAYIKSIKENDNGINDSSNT